MNNKDISDSELINLANEESEEAKEILFEKYQYIINLIIKKYIIASKKYNVEYLSLDELLAQSDIVSLHLAVTPQTVNTVDSKFISKMKKDAFLINTSRGDLVDNDALKNALLSGEIAGAGLDVYTPEPLLKDNPLLDERLKNKLILTPHIAGITDFTVEKIYKNIAENTQNIILKKELKNRVN